MEYEYFYRYAKDRVLETKNNTIQRITPNKYYTIDIINNKKVDNIYLNSLLLATIDTVGASTPTVNNILTDNLGSIQKIVDNTGNILTSQTTYTPYGKVYQNNGTQPLRQYIGEVYDTDTNLNYLNARYYNSNDGKFISQDPVFWELGITKDGKAVLTNPQSLNNYSYANNNPITLKDPSGRVVPIVIAAGLGAAGAYAYYDYKTNTQPTLNDANSGSFDKALAIGMFAIDLTPMGAEGAATNFIRRTI